MDKRTVTTWAVYLVLSGFIVWFFVWSLWSILNYKLIDYDFYISDVWVREYTSPFDRFWIMMLVVAMIGVSIGLSKVFVDAEISSWVYDDD